MLGCFLKYCNLISILGFIIGLIVVRLIIASSKGNEVKYNKSGCDTDFKIFLDKLNELIEDKNGNQGEGTLSALYNHIHTDIAEFKRTARSAVYYSILALTGVVGSVAVLAENNPSTSTCIFVFILSTFVIPFIFFIGSKVINDSMDSLEEKRYRLDKLYSYFKKKEKITHLILNPGRESYEKATYRCSYHVSILIAAIVAVYCINTYLI